MTDLAKLCQEENHRDCNLVTLLPLCEMVSKGLDFSIPTKRSPMPTPLWIWNWLFCSTGNWVKPERIRIRSKFFSCLLNCSSWDTNPGVTHPGLQPEQLVWNQQNCFTYCIHVPKVVSGLLSLSTHLLTSTGFSKVLPNIQKQTKNKIPLGKSQLVLFWY